MSKQHDSAVAFVSGVSEDPTDTGGLTSLTRELARVEEANLAFYEAFTHLDVDRMAGVWSPSPHARCVHPGWELVVGWQEIRQSWSEIFRTIDAIEFELEDVHVEVAGRSAWVNLVAHVRIVTEEGDAFAASVVTTNIFEHFDGQWRMILHQSSNFSEEGDDDEDGGGEDEPDFSN
ncbi:MAG: nuclear transport factor 2 family protein [Deltaproteobacteria bacterium]|jgi:ketosteroid isomerase-like protein